MTTSPPKHHYQWQGRDRSGQLRQGETTAISTQSATEYVQQQGIVPLSVKRKPTPLYENAGRIKAAHIVSFTRQMATMLAAGMPITTALNLLAEGVERPKRLRDMLADICLSVERGEALSTALAAYPRQFNTLYIALVRAGEAGGVLDDCMEKIATTLEKQQALKRQVVKALTYPTLVIAVAIAVMLVLLVWIIPVFETFFADFDAPLPWITQRVIGVSEAVRDWGMLVVFGIFLVCGGGVGAYRRSLQRQPGLGKYLGRYLLKIPVLGKVLALTAMARFARVLSVLLSAGIPLLQGLGVTAPATGNSVYENATHTIGKDIEYGAQLNFAMQSTGLFEPFAVQMVAVGEASGQLDSMLANIATTYERLVDARIERLSAVLEPLLLLMLAVIVGTLVVAMYLPIFMLGDVVG